MQGQALGIVVAVYPEGNSIDVLMPKTGDRLTNVQCAAHTGSSDTGIVDLPEIGLPVDDTRWTLPIIQQAARYIRAIVWNVDGMPICMPRTCTARLAGMATMNGLTPAAPTFAWVHRLLTRT